MAREYVAHAHLMRCSKSTWSASEVLDSPFWRSDLDVHPLGFNRAVFFLLFVVVLEMILFSCECSYKPRAVAAVRSSGMMRRMSSANLRLERFVSWSCSTGLSVVASVPFIC